VVSPVAEAPFDLGHPRRVHIVGVGGTGMSAIATVLAEMGHDVSGSDLVMGAPLERLAALGVAIHIGHDPHWITGVDAVTWSSAVPASNVEVEAARRSGITVLSRAKMLAAVCATGRSVAVAGTHGKTTTSSMLALILIEAGLHPSFVIGGDIKELGAGARWDQAGSLLVVEADESDGTFLELHAPAVVVTSVEPDHLDYYGSLDAMEAAYGAFLGAAPGPRVVCADDEVAVRLAAEAGGAVSYGTSPKATLRMVDVTLARDHGRFCLQRDGADVGVIDLSVPGIHNARNAAGAVTIALELGAPFEAAARALRHYRGVARRFEWRGERDGVTFVDDYGHLPSEVGAALAAARTGGWGRVVAVFQPHRYTRTARLWQHFADAFVDADLLVLTDVYAAGETPIPGVSGQLIADAVRQAHPGAEVIYVAGREGLAAAVGALLRPGDLCCTLGAGDVTALAGELLGQGKGGE